MRYSTTTLGGRVVTCLVAFAMVATLGIVQADPADAVIDTPGACPSRIDSAGFQDLAGLSSSARHAIDCLAEHGITRGTTSTTYAPWEEVLRWQMALYLVRQADAHDIALPSSADVGFVDISDLPVATQRAINQLYRLGIVEGTTSTTFSPFERVPRWQMALFLTRLLNEADVTLPSGTDQGFVDIRALPSQSEQAINQLIRLKISEGTTATTFSPDMYVQRWQMALFLTRTLEAGGIEMQVGGTTTTARSRSPISGAPDLTSVRFDADDDEKTRVLFEFDEPIASTVDADHIRLVGWNGDLIEPDSVRKSEDHSDSVEAVFYNEEYDNAVAGVVTGDDDEGAVYDIDDLYNTMGSDGLHSVTVKSVDWPVDYPELVKVGSFDSGEKTVEFEFDQEVDVITSESDFVLIEDDGKTHTGTDYTTEDVTEDDETITIVTVKFETVSTNDWNDVVRAYVKQGAVDEPDDGLVNLPIAVDVSDSGQTETPYLTGIDLRDADQGIVVFEFNEDLQAAVTASSFIVVLHDGTVLTGDSAEKDDINDDEVEVDFGTLDSDIVIYATVLEGAVTEFGGVVGDENGYDTFRKEYRFDAGDTAGPDLESSKGSTVGLDDDSYTIIFEFDEDLDEDAAEFTFNPDDDLLAWDEDGELITLSGGQMTIDDDTIEIKFDENDDGIDELVDGDIVRFGIFADEIADEFGFTSHPDGVGVNRSK